MRALAILRSLWLTLVRRERLEQSLDEELRAYVDLLAAEYEAAGMDPAQARRRALIETGGIEQVKEATRDAWIGHGVATLAREIRFTLRGLRRAPMFCIVAVAVLGIGIGGAAAIFTVIKGSLLRPLPAVTDPQPSSVSSRRGAERRSTASATWTTATSASRRRPSPASPATTARP